MKTNSSSQQNSGNVLLVTLVITGILGFALASYLTLISSQNRSVARSQTWNTSIPISEAGIEEAIVHLNRNCLWNPITSAPVDWFADEWVDVGNGSIEKRGDLGENYYVVTIVTSAPYSTNDPGIFSKGYVPSSLAKNSSSTLLAAIGVAGDEKEIQYVGRQVRVTTGKDGFLTRAMVAKRSIDLKGKNITTDSFDSRNPAFSTDGLYDFSKRRDHGDVAVNNGFKDSLNVGNASIYGSVATGPGGEIAINGGKVGDAAWMADTTKTGIQPGHSRDDMNLSLPDVENPFQNVSTTTPLLNQWVTNPVVSVSNVTYTSTSYPTNSGTVGTNTVAQTTVGYPIGGTYIGSVITNSSAITTASRPTSNYVGVIATNTALTVSTNVPAAGSYLGNVVTNYTWFTNTFPSYPSGYYGSVITNTVVTTIVGNPPAPPAAGSYVGTITTNWNGGHTKIQSYTYNRITSYKYQKATGYAYERITGYSYNNITGYTVAHITGYTLTVSFYTTNNVVEFYDYVFDSDNYEVSTIDGRVLIRGNATILITDDVDMTGNSEDLQINPDASLRLYMAGARFKITGQGSLNSSGLAERFWYFGLPTNTELKFNGNAAFSGAIYAPQADFTLGGGGSDTWDFIGACVTKDVTMNGHFRFHYDEALAHTGPARGYIISGWNEININDNPNTYIP